MELHCSDSGTPLTIPKAQWMGYQSSVSTSSTATATPTSTSTLTSTSATTSGQQTATVTSTSTPNPDANYSGNTGLSSGAKIGIIAGSAAVGVALLAAALFFCLRSRKRRQPYEEVHPMLLANPQHGPFSDGSADATTHRSPLSMGPSELESAAPSMAGSPRDRSTWHSSSDGSQVPWSPGAFESVKMAQFQSLHQPPPRDDVYEMPAETSSSMSPSTIPLEMPTISVTSPTVSPTSRYSGLDWSSEPPEPRRYEPFRPQRLT